MSVPSSELASTRAERAKGKSQAHSPDREEKAKKARRSGKLVAVTAAGSVYLEELALQVVPVSVALAFIQELASRVLDPQARVLSPRAESVSGEAAYVEWARTTGLVSGWLLRRSPLQRLNFLREVVTYVSRRKSASGIEPLVASALNATWPWVEKAAYARIAVRMARYIAAAEFSAKQVTAVLDVHTKTVTYFEPGELARIDVQEWLDWKSIAEGQQWVPKGNNEVGANQAAPGQGDIGAPGDLLGSGQPGSHGLDLSGLPGADGLPRGEDSFGAALLDELLGPDSPGGVDLGGLPGADGSPRSEDTFGLAILRKLLGSRLPSTSGIERPGQASNRPEDYAAALDALLGPGAPGRHRLDTSNIGGNGGPYGHGSALGPGGAAVGPENAIFIAAIVIVLGIVFYKAATTKPEVEKGPYPEKPPPPAQDLPPIGSDRPPPKDDKNPNPKGLYPDPDGAGGGGPTRLPDDDDHGNPTTMWDEFGGGGTPNSLWDENFGGGNPKSLWDENGGGGNPTTTSEQVLVIGLTGRGLLASVSQIGPRTFLL